MGKAKSYNNAMQECPNIADDRCPRAKDTEADSRFDGDISFIEPKAHKARTTQYQGDQSSP